MNLFCFDLDRETSKWRQSINWEDDDTVVNFTLTQKKDDQSFCFKCGVARVSRAEIERIGNLPQVRGFLSYNREIIDDNPYHGNLILEDTIAKHIRGLVSSALALACGQIIYRNQ